jgi:hypothetical protein
MHFDTYDDLARYPDCRYVYHVHTEASTIVRRVESFNLVGSLLWPDPLPEDPYGFPISLFEWLTVTADVFLMRYISVLDCAIILANEVYECGLEPRKCSIDNLNKKGVPTRVVALLTDLQREFNPACRRLVRLLDRLYNLLGAEFNERFSSKFKVGYGAQQHLGG